MGEAVARSGTRKGDFLAGKYLLGDCLGIGGMGEVYSATNVSLGRNVAIKILNADFSKNEDDVLRFLREARAAAAVRHPNVVDVLDVARDDDGTPFIVQELLSGQDLEQHLQAVGGRMSVGEVLEVMIPVADAVAAAHDQAVVHRDLKPANIFLARDGNRLTPKVLDFGACLYKTVGGLSTKELRMLIGTPHYMAPEQIISKSDVDARADVWALGIILYELLVGETPFEAETANKVLEAVRTRNVPPLRQQAKRAPEELERLVAKCTQRERTRRLGNAAAFRDALSALREARRASVEKRVDTPPDLSPPGDAEPPSARIPSLALATPKHPTKRRGSALLTLSEPDDADLDADADAGAGALGASAVAPGKAKEPPESTQRPIEAARPPRAAADDDRRDKKRDERREPTEKPPADKDDSSRREIGARGLMELDDIAASSEPLELELGTSSAPPKGRDGGGSSHDGRGQPSSLPPVLDPRSAGRTASAPKMGAVKPPPHSARGAEPPLGADPTPRPARRDELLDKLRDGRDARDARDGGAPCAGSESGAASGSGVASGASSASPSSGSPHPPAPASSSALTPPIAPARPRDELRGEDRDSITLPTKSKLTLAALAIVPALAAFAALRYAPVVTAPLRHAMRGESTLASGVLAVVSLVVAAALAMRALASPSRALLVATVSAVLLGIVMIIVTFSASEAIELGIPAPAAGLVPFVAPIVPLALALAAIARARESFAARYEQREAVTFALLASFMLLLVLELCPVGAARAMPGPPAPAKHPPAALP